MSKNKRQEEVRSKEPKERRGRERLKRGRGRRTFLSEREEDKGNPCPGNIEKLNTELTNLKAAV